MPLGGSFLPERARDLIRKWLGQIRQGRSLAGLDETFNRHAGDQMLAPQFRQFFRIDDARRA